MVKLDSKRRGALVIIAIAVVCIVAFTQPQPSQTPTAPATPAATTTDPAAPAAPAAAPAPAAPVATTPAAPATPAPAAAAASTTPFTKFYVFQGNPFTAHYILSGFMPTGNCIKVNIVTDNCKTGPKCFQITYDTACSSQEQGWAGAYWLSPSNNWGDQKGGYTLTGAQKLVFWARGDKGGEVIDSFKIGGITGHKFPDSDTASIGPITLTKDWQQYSIDLTGKDLSYIGGGFAWVATAQANAQPITFYIDDISYQ